MCQAANLTPESSRYSTFPCLSFVSRTAACLLLAVRHDYHHLGCSAWFEEQEEWCCQQRCTADLWVNRACLKDFSPAKRLSPVNHPTGVLPCLCARYLPQQAGETADCLGVSLGQLKALQQTLGMYALLSKETRPPHFCKPYIESRLLQDVSSSRYSLCG